MNKKEMIEELEKGKHPIDVSLQKWIDISKVSSINERRARHQFDEGKDNCALCYFYKNCDVCLLSLHYKVACDESINYSGMKSYEKKYKRDFYAQYRETGDAQIVISALIKLKEILWFVLLKAYIKQLIHRFIRFIKRLFIRKREGEVND